MTRTLWGCIWLSQPKNKLVKLVSQVRFLNSNLTYLINGLVGQPVMSLTHLNKLKSTNFMSG